MNPEDIFEYIKNLRLSPPPEATDWLETIIRNPRTPEADPDTLQRLDELIAEAEADTEESRKRRALSWLLNPRP